MVNRKNKKFYITTPIYYVNDLPHIGHAYTTIAADMLARYYRLRGDNVHFLIGVDENAQKNVESALKKTIEQPKNTKETRVLVQTYVDEMAAKWQKTWDELGITNDDFIRTTEKRHTKFVKWFWEKVKANGDIYKGTYEGLYCTGCEAYKTEADLVDGLCPDHKRKPEKLHEENYFFRLSKYQDKLLEYIGDNPEFIQPASRRNEVLVYIREHLKDFSISRENLAWGIPVPGDKSQTIYVWFDALLNYISANPKWWPADVHLVGKDIIKFHCAYWPAMLMSAGLSLPKQVFAHGFFTIDGQKISKSLGNVVKPEELAHKYGNDVLRYYLLREIPFGGDGDFSEKNLRERYEADLANGVGNFAARVLTMVEKYCDGKVPPRVEGSAGPTWLSYEAHIKDLELHAAVKDVWDLISWCDSFINTEAPWQLAKIGEREKLNHVLYTLLESLRHVATMLLPVMPDTADKILDALGILKQTKKTKYDILKEWGSMLKEGAKIKRGSNLFPKLS